MSDYEKLTRKAESLTTAAREAKTKEGRGVLAFFAYGITCVRDAVAETEPAGGEA